MRFSVARDGFDSPFVHLDPTEDEGRRLLSGSAGSLSCGRASDESSVPAAVQHDTQHGTTPRRIEQ